MEALTDEEREAKVEALEQQTEQEEAEKKEQKEAEKSEHEDKYFVVHGGTCVCDKAVDPSKEAEIVVTKNTKLVINEDDKKFAVTEEDTTMKPPTATFGKCKLKPSNSDYLPCAPAFMPKWEKAYDKKTVEGKKILTELSTLQCTIGGKITIKKHGQENSVVKEHAENTNEAEQVLINPAVPLPVSEIQYPSVSSIDLKTITGRTNFVEVKSAGSGVEKIKVRLNEEIIFNANVKSGNIRLTSWVIYDVKNGKTGNKIITSEQIGTTFKNTFPALGTYRVEGYGKPKTIEYKNGAHNKNYPDCSIDVEVVVNTFEKLAPKEGKEFSRATAKGNKLRQNFPAIFEASFLIEANAKEIENLQIHATDASGNVLQDGTQSGTTFSFTPRNSKASYTIHASYTNENGVQETKTYTATTETPYVNSISHAAEVIRPETPMQFKITSTQYGNSVSAEEATTIKWNLDGKPIGTGSCIDIPGSYFLKEEKHVVEAYVNTANAFGKNAKKENDDWHFEVKKNDVSGILILSKPKVGKTTQLQAHKFIMPPNEEEKVIWNIFGLTLQNRSSENPVIDITPSKAGTEKVTCKINTQKGFTGTIEIVQAEITDAHFTDNNGLKINQASWGQKANIYINHKHLLNEEIQVNIVCKESKKNIFSKTIKKFDGKLIPITLDKTAKSNAGTETQFYIDIDVPKLKALNDNYYFPIGGETLEITEEITFSNVILGEENGSKQHAVVDYDKVSWFYANTTGIKKGEELTIEIWEAVFGFDNDMKLNVKAKVEEDGVLKAKINWNEIPKIKTPRRVYVQVKDKNDKVLYDADGGSESKTDTSSKKSGFIGGATSLLFVATAVFMVENKAAVVVGTQALTKKDDKVCECEAKVRAFMRMIRIGEGTQDEGGYSRIVGGSSFSDHEKDFSDHPKVYIKKYDSTAAGAYQITKTNWNSDSFLKWRNDNKITDFLPESQDKYCVYLIKNKRKALSLIKNDKISEAIDKCSKEWASLPGAGYGQREEKLADILKKYESFYQDELKGVTTLHIKKGFLKEFGENCCGGENQSEVNNGVTLHFSGETAKEEALSNKTKNILKEVGKISGNNDIYITSTARTSHDQARIMYENCEEKGASVQKGIYASAGDKVIDVYIAGKKENKSKDNIIVDMKNKINELDPETVSKHLANPDVMNTFDVSYGRLSDKTKFLSEIKKRSELDKVLVENDCYHIQINQ